MLLLIRRPTEKAMTPLIILTIKAAYNISFLCWSFLVAIEPTKAFTTARMVISISKLTAPLISMQLSRLVAMDALGLTAIVNTIGMNASGMIKDDAEPVLAKNIAMQLRKFIMMSFLGSL